MLTHGENIVDMMGDEIDRIEMNLSVSNLHLIFSVRKMILWHAVGCFGIETYNNVASYISFVLIRKIEFLINANYDMKINWQTFVSL